MIAAHDKPRTSGPPHLSGSPSSCSPSSHQTFSLQQRISPQLQAICPRTLFSLPISYNQVCGASRTRGGETNEPQIYALRTPPLSSLSASSRSLSESIERQYTPSYFTPLSNLRAASVAKAVRSMSPFSGR
jgi:hypothetical protein